jgi:hypothetical protein
MSDTRGWWQIWSYEIADITPVSLVQRSSILASRFEWRWYPNSIFITVPHWFLVLFCGALAAVPWIFRRWQRPSFRIRFSVRTLLLVISFVAVLLGLIAAATQ